MGLDMYLIKRKKGKKAPTLDDLWSFEEELIYWRKANQIHKFFCDNGEEIEEQIAYKLNEQILRNLLDKCKLILDMVKIRKGKVINGQRATETGWEDILEDGYIIENEKEISNILPTQSGFFFGSTNYDNYYLEEIKYTLDSLESVLINTDFKENDIYYMASW